MRIFGWRNHWTILLESEVSDAMNVPSAQYRDKTQFILPELDDRDEGNMCFKQGGAICP